MFDTTVDCRYLHLEGNLVLEWKGPIFVNWPAHTKFDVDVTTKAVKKSVQTLKECGQHTCSDKSKRMALYQDGLVIFGPASNLLIRVNEWADGHLPAI